MVKKIQLATSKLVGKESMSRFYLTPVSRLNSSHANRVLLVPMRRSFDYINTLRLNFHCQVEFMDFIGLQAIYRRHPARKLWPLNAFRDCQGLSLYSRQGGPILPSRRVGHLPIVLGGRLQSCASTAGAHLLPRAYIH
jgi:hypothetical protein